MPRESSKCREWEKERRERLKEAFNLLKKLLPSYDPAINSTQIEIIHKSTEHIQDLQKRLDELLSTDTKNKVEGQEIKKLRERVKKLLNRNEQLCILLKNAGIAVPSVYGLVKKFKPPESWSNRISPKQAEIFQKTEQEKENEPTIKKVRRFNKENKCKKVPLPSKRKKNICNIEKRKSKLSLKKGILSAQKNVIVLQQPITTQSYYVITNAHCGENVLRSSTNSTVITNSLLTSPLVSTSVKPTNILNKQNSSLSSLGPGTLVLTNGTVIPVLPRVQAIPQIITNPFPMQQQTNTILMLSKTLNIPSENSIVERKNISAKNKNLHIIKPKICSTRTTQVNKVPIPALTSRYASNCVLKGFKNNESENKYIGIKKTIEKKNVNVIRKQKSELHKNISTNNPIDMHVQKRPIEEFPNDNVAKKLKLNSCIELSENTEDITSNVETKDSDCQNVNQSTSYNVAKELKSVNQVSTNVVKNSAYKIKDTHLQEPSQQYMPNKSLKSNESKNESMAISNLDKDEVFIKHDNSLKSTIVKHDNLSKQKEMVECNITKVLKDKPNLSLSSTELNNTVNSMDKNEDVNTKKSQKPEKQIHINNEMKTLELNLTHSDLSNDIFASLQVPTGGQNPESTSPTAAFLLAFPLVSSLTGVKVTEVNYEDNTESQRGTPNLLQIGTMDTTKPTQSESLTPNLLNLDNLSFFSAKDICNNFYTSFENNTVSTSTSSTTTKGVTSSYSSFHSNTVPLSIVTTANTASTRAISTSNYQTHISNSTYSTTNALKTYTSFEDKDIKIVNKDVVNNNPNIVRSNNKHEISNDINSINTNTLNADANINSSKKNSQNEESNLNHGISVLNSSSTINTNFNAANTRNININLNTTNMNLINNSSKMNLNSAVNHNTINNQNNNLNSSIHQCANGDSLIQNNSNTQNCNLNENILQTNDRRSSLNSNNINSIKIVNNFDTNIHHNVSANNLVVDNSSSMMCSNSDSYQKQKVDPKHCINYNQTIQHPKTYSNIQCSNFQNSDPRKISSSVNNCTYISKTYPDPLYTNSNTHTFNTTENQNFYKKNENRSSYYPINYENYSDYRKNNSISQFNSSNYYYGTAHAYNNKDKFSETPLKGKNSNINNQTRGPINWMTTPDNRQNLTDYTLTTFSKENDFNYSSIYPTNSFVTNTQSTYFNTNSAYTNTEITNETKKSVDLPLVHSMNSYQRNDIEENQFSWSPTKIPQFLEPPQSFSSTLTNLIGDLALGNPSNFIEQKTDKYLKDNIQRSKDTTRRSKSSSYESSSNFLSVSQLVDHNKTDSTPARTTNRRNSGSRSNKNNTDKTNKRNKSQETKETVQTNIISKRLENNEKYSKTNQMKHFSSQNNNIFCIANDNTNNINSTSSNSKTRNSAKNVPSIYSAEALIGHHLQTDSLQQKSTRNNQSVSSYPPTTKSLPVPPFLSENIIPYFSSVDIPQDSTYNQNQNFQSTGFSHNFTTFQNNTYNNSFIPSAPPITTTYLSSNNFIHDGSSHEYIYDNANLCPNKNSKQYSNKNISRLNSSIPNRDEKNNSTGNNSNTNCSNYRKTKRKVNTDVSVQNFVDFPFLSVPGSINSPILPEDFHSHASFIPPPAPPQLYPCKNPLYSKQNSDLSAGPLLSLPPPGPPVTRSIQHPEISPSLNTGTSLTNFNLSTIFPEINKSPLNEIFTEPKLKDASTSRNYSA